MNGLSLPQFNNKEVLRSEQVVGKDRVLDFPAQMGYDDMSYFMQTVPGSYYYIGSSNKNKGTDYPHHNPRFDIDEDSLLIGTEMHVKLAMGFLESSLQD